MHAVHCFYLPQTYNGDSVSFVPIFAQTVFQLCRVDSIKGWSEIISADYLVIGREGPLKSVQGHKEFGSAQVGSSDSRCRSVTVHFNTVSVLVTNVVSPGYRLRNFIRDNRISCHYLYGKVVYLLAHLTWRTRLSYDSLF